MRQQAEQVKRLGVLRVLTQHASIGLFGLLQATIFMQLDSRRERILHA